MSETTREGAAIELADLRKEYGPKTALAGVSLRVPSGSVFGYVGPSGALPPEDAP